VRMGKTKLVALTGHVPAEEDCADDPENPKNQTSRPSIPPPPRHSLRPVSEMPTTNFVWPARKYEMRYVGHCDPKRKRRCRSVASVRQFEDHWLDPLRGDRVVEIGAVKLVNRSPTGQTFHRYVCQQARLPVRALSR
jgi:DNA polymerase III epsilon subunit-like protein